MDMLDYLRIMKDKFDEVVEADEAALNGLERLSKNMKELKGWFSDRAVDSN